MKSIFHTDVPNKYFFSNNYIDINRSVYFKGYVDIIYQFENIEDMKQQTIKDQLSFNNYKIRYFKSSEPVEYDTWIHALKLIGSEIIGTFSIKNPSIDLVMTRINGVWILGTYTSNTKKWLNRINKPINYSYALEVRLAKSIMNIAINSNFNSSVVDPCCGIGTVVMEALEMGVSVDGFDINSNVVEHANTNLRHFGFDPIIRHLDIHNIEAHYDIAILDIPYGQFSSTSVDIQEGLLKETRRIADKAVIIAMEDMSKQIIHSGFIIQDSCELPKSNAFSRFIYVCY